MSVTWLQGGKKRRTDERLKGAGLIQKMREGNISGKKE